MPELTDEEIKMIAEEGKAAIEDGKKHITWQLFIWVVGAICATAAYLFTMAFQEITKVQAIQQTQSENYVQIQTQLSQIQTDLLWIKNSLK